MIGDASATSIERGGEPVVADAPPRVTESVAPSPVAPPPAAPSRRRGGSWLMLLLGAAVVGLLVGAVAAAAPTDRWRPAACRSSARTRRSPPPAPAARAGAAASEARARAGREARETLRRCADADVQGGTGAGWSDPRGT